MSSSSVCQGLQSCLQSRTIEPRVLRMKLAPPKSNFYRSVVAPTSTPGFTQADNLKMESHTEENNTTTTLAFTSTENNNCDVKSRRNVDDVVRGWSFLQFLSDDKNNKENTQKEKVYVHPLVKRSASMLSDKSLEMCTESLGSETGSEAGDDMTSYITLDTDIYTARDPPKPRETSITRRMKRSLSFPPPLTSISGSKGVQVRPHREDGRLVLEAVTVTTSHTYFHAERSHGRLRLSMMKDRPPNMDNEDHDQAEEDQEEEEEDGEVEEEEEEEEEAFDDDDIEEEEEEEEEEAFDDDDVEEEEVKEGEDIEGNNGKVRGEMGVMKKVAMLSRCKEGGCANNEILNWDSLWVVTST